MATDTLRQALLDLAEFGWVIVPSDMVEAVVDGLESIRTADIEDIGGGMVRIEVSL